MKSKFPRAKRLEPIEIILDAIARGDMKTATQVAKEEGIKLDQKGGKVKGKKMMMGSKVKPKKKMMGGGKVKPKPKAKTKMMYGSKVKKRK
mgnify:FL=1